MRPVPMKPTFMANPRYAVALLKLTFDPFDLARDVVDDVAGLQMLRQHVPGVGLDLELTRQRLRLVEFQRVLDGEARGAELAQVVEEDRHMEVRPPFARAGILLPGLEGVFEIEEAVEFAVFLLDGLRQVN